MVITFQRRDGSEKALGFVSFVILHVFVWHLFVGSLKFEETLASEQDVEFFHRPIGLDCSGTEPCSNRIHQI